MQATVECQGLAFLREWARSEGVEPIVGSVLLAEDLIPPGHKWIDAIYERRAATKSAFHWLESVSDELASSGVRSLVVESAGAVLASEVDEARFCSSDIDLLVEENDLEIWHVTLLERGCQYIKSLPAVARRIYSIPDEADARQVRFLELAWHPFRRSWTRVDHGPLDWHELGEADAKYPGLRRLPPTSAFVYQAVHASLHYYRLPPGLRLHAENQWLVSHPAFCWSEMVTLAAAGRFKRRTLCALRCLAQIYGDLGGGAPTEALARAAGPTARGATSLLRLTERGGGSALRGVLEPLLDDRGAARWLCDLVAFWIASRNARSGRTGIDPT